MVCWRKVPVSFGRRLFIKRRFTFGIVLASIPFLGYMLIFASSRTEPSNSVPVNALCDCPCATRQESQNLSTVKPRTQAVATSTVEVFTRGRKLDFGQGSELAGSLNVHMWSEICGTNVDVLRDWPHFPRFPDKRSFISEFRRPQVLNTKNNGERIFGFVHPQASGKYKFAITSDDTSELWLSPNGDPASSDMIARVFSPDGSAWTEEGDYKRYPDQISKEITLQAGKKYYIESLIKQGSGAAHVAVYWSYSNSKFEIISSKYLSSFSENNNDESIPTHAGKQANTTLRRKSSLYYFNRLPYVRKKEYISAIPTCPYRPSFLAYGKVIKEGGVWQTQASNASRVFPNDDTDMFNIRHDGWSKPNALIDKTTVESLVGKLITSLRRYRYLRTSPRKLQVILETARYNPT